MSQTVEELQEKLREAGRRPEAVQRADADASPLPDGVYLVGPHLDGVRVVMVERGERVHPEDFADEASAVRALARRLLRSPEGRPRTAEETATAVARMQAKAAASDPARGARDD